MDEECKALVEMKAKNIYYYTSYGNQLHIYSKGDRIISFEREKFGKPYKDTMSSEKVTFMEWYEGVKDL